MAYIEQHTLEHKQKYKIVINKYFFVGGLNRAIVDKKNDVTYSIVYEKQANESADSPSEYAKYTKYYKNSPPPPQGEHLHILIQLFLKKTILMAFNENVS